MHVRNLVPPLHHKVRYSYVLVLATKPESIFSVCCYQGWEEGEFFGLFVCLFVWVGGLGGNDGCLIWVL